MGECNINCQCLGPMGGNQRPLLKLESCLPHLCGREVKVLAPKSIIRSLPSKPCCWGPVIDDIPVNTGSHIINDNVWLSYFEINNFIILKVLFQNFQNLCMNSKRSKRAIAPCKYLIRRPTISGNQNYTTNIR